MAAYKVREKYERNAISEHNISTIFSVLIAAVCMPRRPASMLSTTQLWPGIFLVHHETHWINTEQKGKLFVEQHFACVCATTLNTSWRECNPNTSMNCRVTFTSSRAKWIICSSGPLVECVYVCAYSSLVDAVASKSILPGNSIWMQNFLPQTRAQRTRVAHVHDALHVTKDRTLFMLVILLGVLAIYYNSVDICLKYHDAPGIYARHTAHAQQIKHSMGILSYFVNVFGSRVYQNNGFSYLPYFECVCTIDDQLYCRSKSLSDPFALASRTHFNYSVVAQNNCDKSCSNQISVGSALLGQFLCRQT